MTWLSRLLPQNKGFERFDSAKRSKRFRRQAALESLEDRQLLTVVGAYYNPATAYLSIVTDGLNNAIQITENAATAGGTVSVKSVSAGTFVNGFLGTSQTYTTPGPVLNIDVWMPTSAVNNTNRVWLAGAGKTVPTTVQNVRIVSTTTAFTGPLATSTATRPTPDFSWPKGMTNLGLMVTGVDNSGELLVDVGSGALGNFGANPAPLQATTVTGDAMVVNSAFGSIGIIQDPTSTCPFRVTLSGDTAGPVTVQAGNNPGTTNPPSAPDSIVLTGDNFGSTRLTEGNGHGDIVTVTQTSARDMYILQGNGGSGTFASNSNNPPDVVTVNGLTLTSPAGPASSALGNGLVVIQGTGANGNTVNITAVNAPATGTTVTNLLQSNAATTRLASIYVEQGVNVNNPGTTPTTAAATLSGAGNETTNISASRVPGNITVVQANGNTNKATISGSTAGIVFGSPADPLDLALYGGLMTIVQGSGSNDVATMTGNTSNYDLIYQAVGVTPFIINPNAPGVFPVYPPTNTGGVISYTFPLQTVPPINPPTNNWINAINQAGAPAFGLPVIPSPNGSAPTLVLPLNGTGGGGSGDVATISDSKIWGNAGVFQGNGNNMVLNILGNQVGFTAPFGAGTGLVLDFFGNVFTYQGNGNHDTTNVNGTTANPVQTMNNLYGVQGNNNQTGADCVVGALDTYNVNDTTITSDMNINQGVDLGTDSKTGPIITPVAAGYYQANIGTTSPVTVGGASVITQLGGGNFIQLGNTANAPGSKVDFSTLYLDILAGTLPGNLVAVINTNVIAGPQGLFGPFTINSGAADGGIFLDLGGNTNVTASNAFNLVH